MHKELRVAMAPMEVAGYYANLASGFNRLGVDCALLMAVPHSFHYDTAPPRSRIARLALRAAHRSYPGNRSGIARWSLLPAHLLSRAVLLAHALGSYDAFIFSYGDTFMRGAELPLLKLLGKRVVFVFHGSDSRAPYINGKSVRDAGERPGMNLARRARKIKRQLRWINRFADAVIDNPLSGQMHDRPFINWFYVGIPFAYEEKRKAAAALPPIPKLEGVLRVVHAPSDPGSKGTPLIEAAIERARQRGHAIDFIQIKGRPNAEVLAELARCDFVIDELYSDVPGAGLAFEAAAFGKPTIVGGYAGLEFQRWVPTDMKLPTHYCRPEELDDAIEKLAVDATYRLDLGAEAERFVREKCTAQAVAARMLQVIEGATAGWLIDPTQIDYIHGTGMPEETLRNAVRAVIDSGGEQALCLADKPALVQRFKAFAQGQRSVS